MIDKQLDINKYCYDFWKQCNWNTSKLIGIKNAVGIKDNEVATKIIRRNARLYATEILKLSEDSFYDEIVISCGKVSNNTLDDKHLNFFERLSDISIEDEDKILDFVDKHQELSHRHMKSKIVDYVLVHRKNEPGLNKDLNNKLTLYRKSLSKKNKAKDNERALKQNKANLEVAKVFVNSFIESDYLNKTEFCKQIDIPTHVFYKYLKMIKENNPNIYEKYENKMKLDNKEQTINVVLQIAKSLKTANFDLIDYYLLTKNHFKDLNDFNVYCKKALTDKKISNSDFVLLRKFIGYNSNGFGGNGSVIESKTISEEKVLSVEEIINPDFNDNGTIKKGSGRLITIDEKKEGIKFFKDNGIPLNTKTYAVFKKRLLDEEINKQRKKREKSI